MATSPASAAPAFLAVLRKLDASGDQGFEGFVRDCLEEHLGLRFRLMKSGPQGGADIVTDLSANQLTIAIEAKRYGAKTHLPVDALRFKIGEAVKSFPGLDLWVLATTRSITKTDTATLHNTGADHGIAVAVLDAGSTANAASNLTLLAAGAPHAVEAHLTMTAALSDYLARVKAHATYDARLRLILDPFKRLDVGYAGARVAAHRWLETAFADRASAKARLHCHGDLTAAGSTLVTRPAISAALDRWWETGPVKPLALTGAEGTGKTWSLLAWWRDQMRDHPERLPLTLFVPARATGLSGLTGPQLIARLLQERTPERSLDFWTRRLALWLAQEDGPRILLIIDGLNQQTGFTGWEQQVQPLLSDEYKGRIAVAFTCRSLYWANELSGLSALEPKAHEIEVGNFTRAELAEMLRPHHLTVEGFDAAMIGLLEVPRYCQLAIERREALKESGDITIDRLIYEDWSRRYELHGALLRTTVPDFHRFIAEQGARLNASVEDGGDHVFTRKAIVDSLSQDNAADTPSLALSINEIVESRWILPVPGSSDRFKLNTPYVPFALGLALLAEMEIAGIGAAEWLAEHIEPLRGTDRGVAILRAATTAALLRGKAGDESFLILAGEWFEQQNFGRIDVNTMERLIPAEPDRFLDLAERLWLSRRHGAHDENVFIEAFAKAALFARFREALHRRLCDWLGRYWPRHERLLANEHDASARQTLMARLAERAERWDAVAPQLQPIAVVRVRQVASSGPHDGHDQGQLALRAMGILSFLPRKPFIAAILHWAVARAISEPLKPHSAGMDWVLRLNGVDGPDTGAAIVDLAEKLIATGEPVACDAATLILDGLATSAAAALRQTLPTSTVRRWTSLPPATIDDAGFISLPLSKEVAGSLSLHPFSALQQLAYRPELRLHDDVLDALVATIDQLDPCSIMSSGMSRSGEDIDLELAIPAIARWAPEAFANFIRRVFSSATARAAPVEGVDPPADVDLALIGLVRMLGEYWPLLDAPAHAAIAAATEVQRKAALAGGETDPWLFTQVSRLAGKPASEQIRLLMADPDGPNFFSSTTQVLEPPEAADYETLRPALAGPHRAPWLGYLINVDRKDMPSGYLPLLAGFEKDEARARSRIFGVLRSSTDPVLLKAFVETGWRWSSEMETLEGANGSLALVVAARVVEVPDLLARIDPLAWGARLKDHPDDQDALDHFATFVFDALDRQIFPNGIMDGSTWFHPEEAMLLLAEQRGSDLIAALDRILARGAKHAFSFHAFPVMLAIKALMRTIPIEGARIWDALWPAYRQSSWQLDSYESLPFAAPAAALTPLCDRLLADVNTDQAFSNIVGWAIDGGREGWLMERIDRALCGETAADRACALTLVRFLDPTPAAEAAALRAGADVPSEWLSGVAEMSEAAQMRARAAFYWRERFLATNDPDQCHPSMTLFLACADARAITLFERRIAECNRDLGPMQLAIWEASEAERQRVGKKSGEGREKRLFGQDILRSTHSPWRGNPVSISDGNPSRSSE